MLRSDHVMNHVLQCDVWIYLLGGNIEETLIYNHESGARTVSPVVLIARSVHQDSKLVPF